MGVIPRSELGRLLSPSPSIWNLWVHSRFEPSAYGFLVRLLAPEGHADYRFNGSALSTASRAPDSSLKGLDSST